MRGNPRAGSIPAPGTVESKAYGNSTFSENRQNRQIVTRNVTAGNSLWPTQANSERDLAQESVVQGCGPRYGTLNFKRSAESPWPGRSTQDFICLEWMQSQSLKDKLADGLLPSNYALQIRVEIAEAFGIALQKTVPKAADSARIEFT